MRLPRHSRGADGGSGTGPRISASGSTGSRRRQTRRVMIRGSRGAIRGTLTYFARRSDVLPRLQALGPEHAAVEGGDAGRGDVVEFGDRIGGADAWGLHAEPGAEEREVAARLAVA